MNAGHKNARRVEQVEIMDLPVVCGGSQTGTCYDVKRESGDFALFLPDLIKNFEFVPGYKYLIKIDVEAIGKPEHGPTGYDYYLKEVVSRQKVKPDTNARLFLHSWELHKLKDVILPKEMKLPNITFSRSSQQFVGFDGCNSVFGKYKIVDGNRLEFKDPTRTLMACSYEINGKVVPTIDDKFAAALFGSDQFTVENKRLILSYKGKVVMELKAIGAK